MDLEKTQATQFCYSDIFFSYLLSDESHCAKMAKNHVLMYVYSGEFLVEEGLKKTVITKGECVFYSQIVGLKARRSKFEQSR